jgi:hypothetical protein
MKKTFLFIFAFLIVFVISDRILNIVKPSVYKFSESLGWETKPDYKRSFFEKDLYGNQYKIDYQTDENGARVSGSKSAKYSILVIGDSFTMDAHTSNDLSWFGQLRLDLERVLNKEIIIYAIGGGGYGTNQQYIKTKNFLKNTKLEPKIVILQFCINDFMNNSYEWEKQTENYGQYLRRPYFVDNSHFYFDNSTLGKIMRNKYFSYLKSPNYLMLIFGIIESKYFPKSIKIDTKNESVVITKQLINKLSKLFDNNNFYIFNCKEGTEYPENIWFDVLDKSEVNILKNPSFEMKKISETKKIFFRDGGHYNELGNKLLGNLVSKDLKFLLE